METRDECHYSNDQLWLNFSVCESIILRQVGVPSYAVQGKEAVLSCDYNLEGQDLYAVKWYKNGHELLENVREKHGKSVLHVRGLMVRDSGRWRRQLE